MGVWYIGKYLSNVTTTRDEPLVHSLLPISCHLPLWQCRSLQRKRDPHQTISRNDLVKKRTDPEISCYTSVTRSNNAHGLPRSSPTGSWSRSARLLSHFVLVSRLFSKPFELMLLLCLTLGSCMVHGLHRARNASVCNVTICLTCFPGLIKKHNKRVMKCQYFVYILYLEQDEYIQQIS